MLKGSAETVAVAESVAINRCSDSPKSFYLKESCGLPASIQVEATILGAMMLDGVASNRATPRLLIEDFSLASHRRTYAAILAMKETGQAVEVTTFATRVSKGRS